MFVTLCNNNEWRYTSRINEENRRGAIQALSVIAPLRHSVFSKIMAKERQSSLDFEIEEDDFSLPRTPSARQAEGLPWNAYISPAEIEEHAIDLGKSPPFQEFEKQLDERREEIEEEALEIEVLMPRHPDPQKRKEMKKNGYPEKMKMTVRLR